MPNPHKEQFVVKLSIDGYNDFGRWMTATVPGMPGTRRYQIPEGLPKPQRLSSLISTKLSGNADIFEDCALGPTRKWNDDTDEIVVDRDVKMAKRYPVAVPETICEDEDGDIDLTYLKTYVARLCELYAKNQDDAAYALLGMYFLSRCR